MKKQFVIKFQDAESIRSVPVKAKTATKAIWKWKRDNPDKKMVEMDIHEETDND